MKTYVVPVLLVFSISFAETATQTDWSGGAGTPGPVSSWGSEYDCDSGMSGVRTIGSTGLHLGSIPSSYQALSSSFDGAFCMHPFDVNLDGSPDILCPGFQEDEVTWWQNQCWTSPPFVRRIVDATVNGPECETAADFDLDGDNDIASAVFYDDLFALHRNDDGAGTAWTRQVLSSDIWGPTAVSAADLNGDGRPDIAGSAGQPPEYFVWINSGAPPPWPLWSVSADYAAASSLCTGDIDGDGDIDIMGTMDAGGGIPGAVWFENTDGSGVSWASHEIETEFESVGSGSLADVDRDGDLDAAGCVVSQSLVAWWENMDGQGGSWARHVVATDMYQPCSEWAEDMDGDLDLDIVAASASARSVCWWQNTDGRGAQWIEHFAGTDIYTPWEVISADLDLDGDHEFPLGLEHSIRIYSAVGPSTNGWLESSILYLGCDPSWDFVAWTASVPFDATLGVQVRSSDAPGDMGDWSSVLTTPGSIAGLLQDGDSYLQYRLVMTTGASGLLPSLHDISFTFDPLGIGEGGEPPSSFGIALKDNPVHGTVVLRLDLPWKESVLLAVFDVSGRAVLRAGPVVLEAGAHEIALGDLPPGMYFARAAAGDLAASERFAVVR